MIQFTRVELYESSGNPRLRDLGPVFIRPGQVVAVVPMRAKDKLVNNVCHIITTCGDWRTTVHGSVDFILNQINRGDCHIGDVKITDRDGLTLPENVIAAIERQLSRRQRLGVASA